MFSFGGQQAVGYFYASVFDTTFPLRITKWFIVRILWGLVSDVFFISFNYYILFGQLLQIQIYYFTPYNTKNTSANPRIPSCQNPPHTNNMFHNPKANKLLVANPTKTSLQLQALDSKLSALHGQSYQQALYTEFEHEKYMWIPFGYDREWATIYAVYGWMLQEGDLGMVRLGLVRALHEEVYGKEGEGNGQGGAREGKEKEMGRGVTIVYFSRGESRNKSMKNKKKINHIQFTDFKNTVLKNLQTKYLRHIKAIYTCHQGFLAKSINNFPFPKFGLHNELIECMIKFCDKLEDLVECLGPLFECQMVKEEVQEYNGKMDWMGIFTDQDKKLAKRRMIEEVGEIDTGATFYKKKIPDYYLEYQTGIPIILNSLLKTLQSNPSHLESEGLFRKACRQQRLKKLQQQLIDCCLEQQVLKIASRYDADTIACCVKGIFNKFNPPIVEYQYYENLIVKMDAMWKSTGGKQGTGEGNGDQSGQTCQTESNIPTSISQKFTLPQDRIDQLLAYLSYFIGPNERAILLRLIRFFRDSILPNEKKNKMSAYNLSVVMGPCIFRPKKYSIGDLMNSPRFAYLLRYLIEDPDKLE